MFAEGKQRMDRLAETMDAASLAAFQQRTRHANDELSIGTKTAETFREQLEEAKESLRLLPRLDEGAIERLQTVVKDIAAREKELKTNQREYRRLKQRIDATLERFNTELDKLVSTISEKFSAAFSSE